VDPLPRLRVSPAIDTPKASTEMPEAHASDLVMNVVTVGKGAKTLRRDVAEVRVVEALLERTISSRPLHAAGMRACPCTLPRTVCCAPRKPSSPTAPATEPTKFVAPTYWHVFSECNPGTLGRMIMGRYVHAPGVV
jgi:hypothetical protein